MMLKILCACEYLPSGSWYWLKSFAHMVYVVLRITSGPSGLGPAVCHLWSAGKSRHHLREEEEDIYLCHNHTVV